VGAPFPQRGDVGLGGRVSPHLDVHRRSQQRGAAGGQRQGGEQVVGQAVGQLGQRVGGSRGDDQQVGGLGQADVDDVGGQDTVLAHGGVQRAPQAGENGATGEGLEGERRDKAGCRFRHHHVHLRPGLGQPAGERADLVSGDAAGDAQEDAFVT